MNRCWHSHPRCVTATCWVLNNFTFRDDRYEGTIPSVYCRHKYLIGLWLFQGIITRKVRVILYDEQFGRRPLVRAACRTGPKALLGIWLGWRATRQIAPASPFLPAGLVADPIHCLVIGWLGWLFAIHSSHPFHFQNFRWRIFSYCILQYLVNTMRYNYHLQVVSASGGWQSQRGWLKHLAQALFLAPQPSRFSSPRALASKKNASAVMVGIRTLNDPFQISAAARHLVCSCLFSPNPGFWPCRFFVLRPALRPITIS